MNSVIRMLLPRNHFHSATIVRLKHCNVLNEVREVCSVKQPLQSGNLVSAEYIQPHRPLDDKYHK
jgi:hypothetical protein